MECGATYKTNERRQQKHCSLECRKAANSVEKTCAQCGKTFRVANSSTDRYRVCSIECRRANTLYKRCGRCGTVFAGKADRKFCSEECRRPPVMIDCLQCGNTVRIVPASRARFCSARCYKAYDGETIPEQNVRLSLTTLDIGFE